MSDLRVAHSVLEELFSHDPEPIPAWGHGDLSKLETCRASIEVDAFGIRKYRDVESCAAKLFYSTIKLHPFPNGNKRFALVLLFVFLIRNGRRLTVGPGINAEMARWVAASDPHAPEGEPGKMIAELTDFFRENLAPHRWGTSVRGP